MSHGGSHSEEDLNATSSDGVSKRKRVFNPIKSLKKFFRHGEKVDIASKSKSSTDIQVSLDPDAKPGCMEGNLSNHRKCQSADSIFPLTSYRLAQPHSKQNENLKNDNSEDDTNNDMECKTDTCADITKESQSDRMTSQNREIIITEKAPDNLPHHPPASHDTDSLEDLTSNEVFEGNSVCAHSRACQIARWLSDDSELQKHIQVVNYSNHFRPKHSLHLQAEQNDVRSSNIELDVKLDLDRNPHLNSSGAIHRMAVRPRGKRPLSLYSALQQKDLHFESDSLTSKDLSSRTKFDVDVKSSPRIPPVVSGVKLRSTQKKDVNYEQNIPSFQKQDPELNPVESISAVVRDFDRARVPAKRSSTFVKSRTKSDSFGDQTSSSSELAQMFDKFQRRKVVQNDGVKTGSDEAAGNSAMLGRSTECCDGKISKEKNSLNDELESSACTGTSGRLVSMQIRSLSHSADSTSARMSIRNYGVFSNAGPHQRRDSKEKSVEIKSEETKKGSDDKTMPNSNSKRKAFSTSGKNSASMNRAFTPAANVTPIPTVSLKNVHESVSENKKDFNLKKTHTDMIAKRRSSSSASVGIAEKAPATELPMKFHSKPVGDLKKIANVDDPGATGKSENHNSSSKMPAYVCSNNSKPLDDSKKLVNPGENIKFQGQSSGEKSTIAFGSKVVARPATGSLKRSCEVDESKILSKSCSVNVGSSRSLGFRRKLESVESTAAGEPVWFALARQKSKEWNESNV